LPFQELKVEVERSEFWLGLDYKDFLWRFVIEVYTDRDVAHDSSFIAELKIKRARLLALRLNEG